MTTTESEQARGVGPERGEISDELVDELMAKVQADGVELLGPDGL